MAIEMRSVTKRFGTTVALDNVTLRLEEGNIYGLLGNNGAGKSTLMNLLAGRLFPDGGEITVDGLPAEKAGERLHLMSEQNLFPEGMRVRRAFEVMADFYPGFDREKALVLSERFGLDTRKKITRLSTGYASIFRLVAALCVNTPWLLLDEPVLGLDAAHRDLFYRLLIEHYAESGCTVVISTHLIQEVAEIIGHSVIIRDGRILRDAPNSELLSGCYTVSGPAARVEDYAAGQVRLSENSLGGLKTVYLQGQPEGELPAGLEVGKMDLQSYFISLMNGEGEK